MKRSLLFFTIASLLYCSKSTHDVTSIDESEAEQTFRVTFVAGKGGAVSTNGGVYEAGVEITVTAIPSIGYVFKQWSDGSVENPKTMVITTQIELVADFDIQTLTFDYSDFGYPSLGFHPEGLGYIELDDKAYLMLPFAELQSDKTDYLRAFEVIRESSVIVDKTHEVFDTPPTVGFTKGPMLISDFDKDGYKDFFLVDHGQENERVNGNFKGAYLHFYYGSAQGFRKQNFKGITDLNLFYHHADIGDFDRDGDVDILSQRWPSYDHDVPAGNTMAILINEGGNFSIRNLENPLNSIGSVLLTNLDDDPDLEALAGTYSYADGALWYWDILTDSVAYIQEEIGAYPMDDIIELHAGNNSRILMFSELDNSPVLSVTDKGMNLFESSELYDYQARDIIVQDFNQDGWDDFYMYFGDDKNGDWGTTFGTFRESLFINDGKNSFVNPSQILDQYGRSLENESNIHFYPLKGVDGAYRFIKFQKEYALQPPISAQIVDLTITI